MEHSLIIWLGCSALAVIVVLVAWTTTGRKTPRVCFEETNKSITVVVDFEVSFFGSKTGWHGVFRDGHIIKNGVLINVKDGDLQTHDLVRAIVRGMKDGLWQLEPIKLSYLEEGKVIALEKEPENFSCLYPNKYGYAMVGVIESCQPLKANKKYAVKKEFDGVFTLA